VRDHSRPVFRFLPNLMPASKVFDGWSNDCHWKAALALLLCSRTTRLPDSSSCATEEAEAPVVFEDQAVWPEPSRRRRPTRLLITRTPEELFSGVSRLATHKTASVPDAVNQIPRYLLVGTVVDGEKKPRVNEPLAESSVSPSVMLPPLFSVSDEMPAPAPELLLRSSSSVAKIRATRLRTAMCDVSLSLHTKSAWGGC